MQQPLLTIIVPTYNRAVCLSQLLKSLREELKSSPNQVAIIIGDNASSDKTHEVAKSFQLDHPNALILRHQTNLGPEENFCRCIEHVKSKYFWIIGDDDLPATGSVGAIINILKESSVDLIYLESKWTRDPSTEKSNTSLLETHPIHMSREAFAKRVNVYFTFISGLIVNLELYRNKIGIESIRKFFGTNLVQLGWVLNVLRVGTKFVYLQDNFIYARIGNSGGYELHKTFGANFSEITKSVFGPKTNISKYIISRNIISYLPALTWNARFEHVGSFSKESLVAVMRPSLGKHVYFWLLIYPIATLPKFASTIALKLTQQISKIVQAHDRLRENSP